MAQYKKNQPCSLFPYERSEIFSIQDASQKAGWMITSFDLPTAWLTTQGEGIKVAVIDTGCDMDHPNLIDNLLPGFNVLDPTKPPEDDNSHGCAHPKSIIRVGDFSGTIEEFYEKTDEPEYSGSYDGDGEWHTKDIRARRIEADSIDERAMEQVVGIIERVHKIRVDQEICRIKIGDTCLKLTPWHPVLMWAGGKIARRRADEIKSGDRIARPRSNGPDYGTVTDVSKESFDGYFYDFTMESHPNYVADGYFISNTHCAGVIAAENNEIGMVGVAPKAKIIPIKVLDKDGNGNLANVAKGIMIAISMGADIITMSLGSPAPVPQLHKVIQIASRKGIPIFVAAGNGGNTKDVYYPSAYAETIAVGAIDETFKRASFSNTGSNLDFMAPGVNILSTVPDNWYAMMSGTSMATPFVAGIGALLLSAARKYNVPMDDVEAFRDKFREHTFPIQGDGAGDGFFQGFGIISVKDIAGDWKVPGTTRVTLD